MALTEIDRGGRWLGLKGEAAVVAVVSMMEVKSNSYFVVVCFVQLSAEFELTYDNFDHFALPSAMMTTLPTTVQTTTITSSRGLGKSFFPYYSIS